MLERIEELRAEAAAAIASAAGTAELEELRVRYLGRKAELTTILRGIAELPAEERGPVGSGRQRGAPRRSRRCSRSAPPSSTPASSRAGWPSDRSTSPCPARRRAPVGHLHLITRTGA